MITMNQKHVYEITKTKETEHFLVFLIHDLVEQDMFKVIVNKAHYDDNFGFYFEDLKPEIIILNYLEDYKLYRSDKEIEAALVDLERNY